MNEERARSEIMGLIFPNSPKCRDEEMFDGLVRVQAEFMTTDEYKTAGLTSFSVGSFSASRGVTPNSRYARFDPLVVDELRRRGYLYRGVGVVG